MDRENERPIAKTTLAPPAGGSGYRSVRLFVLLGTVYGIVTGGVFSTSPTAVSVVVYVAPVCAVVGIAAGAWYGFFFNISNHCTGGRLVWGMIAGCGAAATGTLLVALLAVWVGTLVGFAGGWMVGSILRSKRRGGAPWIGAGVGAVIQAVWTDPAMAVQTAALSGVVGAMVGPLFLLMCVGLGVFAVRPFGPPRDPFDG